MSSQQVTDAHVGGSGPPVLLLHGVNASWRVWLPVMPALEARHRVVAPTLSGHRGGPELDPASTDVLASLADAIEARLDADGIDRLPIVGNSLGGWLALELAQRDRATSVVAFSPAGGWRRPKDLARLVRLFKVGGMVTRSSTVTKLLARPKARRLLLRAAFERGDLIPAGEVEAFVADMAACTALPALLAQIQRPGSGLGTLALPAGCPVRIAWPVKDRTIPFAGYGQPVVDLLPGAEVVTLPGVGHVPMYDDPDLVARTILDFIDGPAPASDRGSPQTGPGPR